MFEQPQEQHVWLQQLVGEWSYEHECAMGPDQPPSKVTGAANVRSLGGMWILVEGEGEMPGGGTATSIITLGYDMLKQRFVGSFIASMMTYFWLYEGSLDTATNTLTLDAEGPSMAGDGKLAKYQDIIGIRTKDHFTLTSRMLGDDGQWNQFMEAHYRRKQ